MSNILRNNDICMAIARPFMAIGFVIGIIIFLITTFINDCRKGKNPKKFFDMPESNGVTIVHPKITKIVYKN